MEVLITIVVVFVVSIFIIRLFGAWMLRINEGIQLQKENNKNQERYIEGMKQLTASLNKRAVDNQ